MFDNNTQQKIDKNTRFVVGINALKRMRTLVDGFQDQEQKNKRTAIIIIIVFAVILLAFLYTFITADKHDGAVLDINTEQPVNR